MARIRSYPGSENWLEEIPIHQPGQPLPGGWSSSESGSQWIGQRSWRTQHGSATLVWDSGRPRWVFNAYVEGHGRVDLGEVLGPGQLWRIKTHQPNWYPWATLEIGDDDIRGVEVEPVVDMGDENEELFIKLLTSDARLTHEIRNNFAFAQEFSQYLQSLNKSLCTLTYNGVIHDYSLRTLGWVVARIRGQGHTYLDFYGRRPSEYDYEEDERVPTWEELEQRLLALGFTIERPPSEHQSGSRFRWFWKFWRKP